MIRVEYGNVIMEGVVLQLISETTVAVKTLAQKMIEDGQEHVLYIFKREVENAFDAAKRQASRKEVDDDAELEVLEELCSRLMDYLDRNAKEKVDESAFKNSKKSK